jgi:hypothetical protein
MGEGPGFGEEGLGWWRCAPVAVDGFLHPGFLDLEPHGCARFWMRGRGVGLYGPKASWSTGLVPVSRDLVGWSGTGCHQAVLVGLCAATVENEHRCSIHTLSLYIYICIYIYMNELPIRRIYLFSTLCVT